MLAAALLALPFVAHPVATDLRGGYQVVAVDLTRDGKPDLVALASGMDELVWFENPGWQRRVLARGLRRAINCAARDLDGDGVPEVVVAHEFSNNAAESAGVVSLLTHQGDPRQPWAVRELDRLTTSHRLRWADVDGNGGAVLVNAPLTGAAARPPEYQDRVPLVSYRPGAWRREPIDATLGGVLHGIFITRWRPDRDAVLTASFDGLHLHERRGGRWTRERLSRGDPAPWPRSGASDVAVGQLGRARFLTAIEPWHGHQVVTYQRRWGRWRRTVIEARLRDGHALATLDIDGDGRDEILAGCRQAPRGVYLYREANGRWTRETLDATLPAAACAVADLNGDRRPDIACIGGTSLSWHENVAAPAGTVR